MQGASYTGPDGPGANMPNTGRVGDYNSGAPYGANNTTGAPYGANNGTAAPYAGNTKNVDANGMPLPATYNDPAAKPRRRKGGCGRVCCGILACLCCLFITAIVAIGILVLVLWFLLKPSTPDLNLLSTQFSPLNQTTTGNNTIVAGSGTVVVQLINHNRVSLRLTNSTVATYYINTNPAYLAQYTSVDPPSKNSSYVNLGNTTVPAFVAAKHSTNNITVPLTFDNTLPSPYQSTFLSSYRAGSVPMQVDVYVDGKVRIWGVTSPRVTTTYTCNFNLNPTTGSIANKLCKRTQSGVH